MQVSMAQQQIDEANAAFWTELCGTGFANVLGLNGDYSAASLEKFDNAFFDFYPYLLPHIKPEKLKNQTVLEIGLGYGSLGQAIAKAGADYHGLDIAQGPINMMNHRLRLLNLPAKAQQGNILVAPFEDNSFDTIISIGCLHHTGNLQQCFNEIFRMLKPGGRTIFMVYNKFSLRQWRHHFFETLANLLFPFLVKAPLSEEQKRSYDKNSQGDAAPETILSSIRELKRMLAMFRSATFHKENCDDSMKHPRAKYLHVIGPRAGLDIYVECIK